MCKENPEIDTMNVLFDTINKQIYIMASAGSNFEMKIVPMDENLTKQRTIQPADPNSTETSESE